MGVRRLCRRCDTRRAARARQRGGGDVSRLLRLLSDTQGRHGVKAAPRALLGAEDRLVPAHNGGLILPDDKAHGRYDRRDRRVRRDGDTYAARPRHIRFCAL